MGAVQQALRRAGVAEAWLVGGLLRDLAAGAAQEGGRVDLDVALPGSGAAAAAEVARVVRGTAFALDEAQGAWRVACPGPIGDTVDLVPLRAPDLAGDLRGRDFTINAVAWDLLGERGLRDPLGGLVDLGRRRLALCSPASLTDDPLRVLRAYRFAFGLGLEWAEGLPAALASAAAGLATVSPERVRTELFAVLALPNGSRALRALAEHGVLVELFAFVRSWTSFDQGDYHSHDLLEHSLRAAEAAEALAADPERAGLPRPDALRRHLAEELEAGVSREALLKAVAFLHDLAKPETLTVEPGGRRRFLGHEVQGGHLLRRVLGDLRLGRRARAAAQNIVAAHLRLFGLAHQDPPTRSARLRYLRDLRADVPEALLLSIADEIATGPNPPALPAVLRASRELLALHWEQREKREIPPLLRGRDLLEALGLAEGPAVGELLRRVAEAEARGEVATRGEALALARRLVEQLPEEEGAPASGAGKTEA